MNGSIYSYLQAWTVCRLKVVITFVVRSLRCLLLKLTLCVICYNLNNALIALSHQVCTEPILACNVQMEDCVILFAHCIKGGCCAHRPWAQLSTVTSTSSTSMLLLIDTIDSVALPVFSFMLCVAQIVEYHCLNLLSTNVLCNNVVSAVFNVMMYVAQLENYHYFNLLYTNVAAHLPLLCQLHALSRFPLAEQDVEVCLVSW